MQISKEFPVLMSQLVQRYFREKGSEQNLSELEALRQELKEIRTKLEEITPTPERSRSSKINEEDITLRAEMLEQQNKRRRSSDKTEDTQL